MSVSAVPPGRSALDAVGADLETLARNRGDYHFSLYRTSDSVLHESVLCLDHPGDDVLVNVQGTLAALPDGEFCQTCRWTDTLLVDARLKLNTSPLRLRHAALSCAKAQKLVEAGSFADLTAAPMLSAVVRDLSPRRANRLDEDVAECLTGVLLDDLTHVLAQEALKPLRNQVHYLLAMGLVEVADHVSDAAAALEHSITDASGWVVCAFPEGVLDPMTATVLKANSGPLRKISVLPTGVHRALLAVAGNDLGHKEPPPRGSSVRVADRPKPAVIETAELLLREDVTVTEAFEAADVV